MPTATPVPAPLASSGDALPPDLAIGQSILHRLRHLGLVLWVSLSMPIAGCIYYLLGGTAPTAPIQQQFRLVGALITEGTSLTVLWYVMSRQGRTWKDIGWKLELADVPRALGLLIAANVVTYLLLVPVQYSYRAYSGHFMASKSLHSMF